MAIEIEYRSDLMSGQPCLRGTRIPVAQLLAELAEGKTPVDVEQNYGLEKDRVVHLLECLSGSIKKMMRAMTITQRLDKMDRWYGDTIASGCAIDLTLKIVQPRKKARCTCNTCSEKQ